MVIAKLTEIPIKLQLKKIAYLIGYTYLMAYFQYFLACFISFIYFLEIIKNMRDT
ncbi:hypothetical protein DB41_HH00330 [Neochlamydia sp. TUME1]|nr:hypothetical protein DB41_HH00330 [Neochlamydia sp. TUME1]